MFLAKRRFKERLAVLIVFFLFLKSGAINFAEETRTDNLPNIIILTLNGVRNIDSISDPTQQGIPNLMGKMFKEGALYTNLVDLNFEFHMPTLAAINTGLNYPFYAPRIAKPTFFQYARRKYSLPVEKVWFIGHWSSEMGGCDTTPGFRRDTYPSQLALILEPNFPTTLLKIMTKQELIFADLYAKSRFSAEQPQYPQWDIINEIEYRFFKKIVHAFKPKIVHFTMNGPESAHYDQYSRYKLEIKRCDEIIYEIWQLVRNDPFYKDNTYLFVCVDHERNQYYMHHSDNVPYENPSRVWMYIYGPDVKKGTEIKREVHHIDIFATIADILKLKTHPTEGRVLGDCFIKERK